MLHLYLFGKRIRLDVPVIRQDDSMTRFMTDANVLMNASLVANSSARRLLDSIGQDPEHSLCIDETTWRQVASVLDRKARQLRLGFSPFARVEAYTRRVGILHLAPAIAGPNLQTVNRADRSLAAAVHEHECVLITDDHELVAECRNCDIDARTVIQAGVRLGRPAPSGQVVGQRRLLRDRQRAKASGHYFFRGQLRDCARASTSTPTAFDAVGRVHVYYDCANARWIANLDGVGQEIVVPFNQIQDRDTLIVLSYLIDSQPGHSDKFRLSVGVDLQNQNHHQIRARGLAWLQSQRGSFHLGCSRRGQDQLNGLIAQIGYGPGQIGQDTWRAMLQHRGIMPSMYDADVLDAALLETNRRASDKLFEPRLAELF